MKNAFITLSYYCSIDSLLICVSWIIVFTSVHQRHWIRSIFDAISMGRRHSAAFRWCDFWKCSAEDASSHWRKDFNLVNLCFKEDQWTATIEQNTGSAFCSSGESVCGCCWNSVKRKPFADDCTLCFFFSVSAFYRKCPSITSSCRLRTWRATWTLACPTPPPPSSLSLTSTTTLPCWHRGLWVKGVGKG